MSFWKDTLLPLLRRRQKSSRVIRWRDPKVEAPESSVSYLVLARRPSSRQLYHAIRQGVGFGESVVRYASLPSPPEEVR